MSADRPTDRLPMLARAVTVTLAFDEPENLIQLLALALACLRAKRPISITVTAEQGETS